MKHPRKTGKPISTVSSIAFMCGGVLLLLKSGEKTGYIGTLKDFLGDIFPITIPVCFLAGYLIRHSRIKLAARTFMTLPILAIGAPFVGINGGFFNFAFRTVRFLSSHPAFIGIPAVLTVAAVTLFGFRFPARLPRVSHVRADGLPPIIDENGDGSHETGIGVDMRRPTEVSAARTPAIAGKLPDKLSERIKRYQWTGKTDLKDIYGYVDFVEKIKGDVERYMRGREAARQYMTDRPLKAYLLYGAGGTGKSHAARCVAGHVAKEYGFYVFDVKNWHQLQGSNWQASLKALKEFLDTIKECRAEGILVSVIWDELDGYCASNLPSDAKRVAAMKAAFDEWAGQTGPPMIFLGTTNEPQEFSEEMLRPGRLTPVYFPPPDLDARAAIIREHFKGKNLHQEEKEEIIRWLAKESKNATVAELLAYLDIVGLSVYEKARKMNREIPIQLQDFQSNKLCVSDYDVFLKKMSRKFSGRHSHKVALFSELANIGMEHLEKLHRSEAEWCIAKKNEEVKWRI
jgi:ATPase family associated with various cellular activities (AAA)